MTYYNYYVLREMVLEELGSMLSGSRGSCIYVRPSRLARRMGLPSNPGVYRLLRHVLEELVGEGLLRIYETRGNRRYYVLYRSRDET